MNSARNPEISISSPGNGLQGILTARRQDICRPDVQRRPWPRKPDSSGVTGFCDHRDGRMSWQNLGPRMTVAEKVELLREEITACKNDVHQLEVFLYEVKSRVDRLAARSSH
jgi:hypothetical protein